MEWPQGGPPSFSVPFGRDLGSNEAPMGSRERNQHLLTVTAPLNTSPYSPIDRLNCYRAVTLPGRETRWKKGGKISLWALVHIDR